MISVRRARVRPVDLTDNGADVTILGAVLGRWLDLGLSESTSTLPVRHWATDAAENSI